MCTYFRIATCFGLNRRPSGYKYNVLTNKLTCDTRGITVYTFNCVCLPLSNNCSDLQTEYSVVTCSLVSHSTNSSAAADSHVSSRANSGSLPAPWAQIRAIWQPFNSWTSQGSPSSPARPVEGWTQTAVQLDRSTVMQSCCSPPNKLSTTVQLLPSAAHPSSPLTSSPHPNSPHPNSPNPNSPHPNSPHPSSPHPSSPLTSTLLSL
jgi:hypothetical protein